MVIDRLRRSLRGLGGGNALSNKEAESHAHKVKHEDELNVRRGAECSFPVKYLGSIEVREARGVDVCERALEQLRRRASTGSSSLPSLSQTAIMLDSSCENTDLSNNNYSSTACMKSVATSYSLDLSKKEQKLLMSAVANFGPKLTGVLHITSDGLRFVASDTERSERQLLVDQTLDRVSFCAPDRRHTRAFAYICRDAASRRWICHGFHAIASGNHASEAANLGERVAHAIGCAFVVCHERKQQLEMLALNKCIQQQQHNIQQHLQQLQLQQVNDQNGGQLSPAIVKLFSSQPISPKNLTPTPVHAPTPAAAIATAIALTAAQQQHQQTQNHLVFTRPPISERLVDPQTCLIRNDSGPRPAANPPLNPYAIERPRANANAIGDKASRRANTDTVPNGRMLAAAICKSRCAAA